MMQILFVFCTLHWIKTFFVKAYPFFAYQFF